jgi:hypothetical protein
VVDDDDTAIAASDVRLTLARTDPRSFIRHCEKQSPAPLLARRERCVLRAVHGAMSLLKALVAACTSSTLVPDLSALEAA